MPTLLARRYGRPSEQVSKVEKVIGALLVLLLAGVGGLVCVALTVHSEGAGASAVAPAAATGGREGSSPAMPVPAAGGKAFNLPKIAKSGWIGPEGVQWFSPETVHQKIDGRDGLYLAYEMVGMTYGTYKDPKRADCYLDVYVYDLGKTLSAFGCYKAEYAEGMPAIAIGRGGYQAERSLFYWKGSHYVQIIAGDGTTDADGGMIKELAEEIAAKITDDGAPLWGDTLLPKEHRKPNSLGYELNNAFSLDFLKRVFRAGYKDGEAEYTLFIHRSDTPDQAKQLFDKYAAYLAKYGKLLSRQESPAGQTLAGEVLDMFDVVFCKGRYLGGVNGADKRAVAEKHAVAFRDALKVE